MSLVSGTTLNPNPSHIRHIHSARAPKSDSKVNRRPKSSIDLSASSAYPDIPQVYHGNTRKTFKYSRDDSSFLPQHDVVEQTDSFSSLSTKSEHRRRSSAFRYSLLSDGVSTPVDLDDDSDTEDSPSRPEYTPEENYERLCKMERIVPSHRFKKQLGSPVIDMSNSILGLKDIKAICVALTANVSALELDLSGNDLGTKGSSYVCQGLRENTAVNDLNLSDTNMGLDGLQCFTDLFLEGKPMRVLDLSGNKFYHPHAELLSQVLATNDSIRDLTLANNSMEDEGGIVLAKALAKNSGLTRLDLSWNHLRRDGAVAICRCLAYNTALVELDLSWNGLAEEGCAALKVSLPVNHTLKELDISCNRINIFALKFLLEGLDKNDTLEDLKIDQNPLTTDGAIALVKMIEGSSNSNIKTVHMVDIPINGDFLDALAALNQKKEVTVFHRDPNKKRITPMIRERSLKDFDPCLILFEYMKQENLRLIDLFRTFDTDSSHSVSKTELKEGFMTINLPIEEEAIDSIFSKLDLNKDNEIEYDELKIGHRRTMRQFRTTNEIEEAKKNDMMSRLKELINSAMVERRQQMSDNAKKRNREMRKSSLTAVFKVTSLSPALLDKIKASKELQKELQDRS